MLGGEGKYSDPRVYDKFYGGNKINRPLRSRRRDAEIRQRELATDGDQMNADKEASACRSGMANVFNLYRRPRNTSPTRRAWGRRRGWGVGFWGCRRRRRG